MLQKLKKRKYPFNTFVLRHLRKYRTFIIANANTVEFIRIKIYNVISCFIPLASSNHKLHILTTQSILCQNSENITFKKNMRTWRLLFCIRARNDPSNELLHKYNIDATLATNKKGSYSFVPLYCCCFLITCFTSP